MRSARGRLKQFRGFRDYVGRAIVIWSELRIRGRCANWIFQIPARVRVWTAARFERHTHLGVYAFPRATPLNVARLRHVNVQTVSDERVNGFDQFAPLPAVFAFYYVDRELKKRPGRCAGCRKKKNARYNNDAITGALAVQYNI